jgi:G:T-mismatch repair DNA endonuclease (very short patch repair protein)
MSEKICCKCKQLKSFNNFYNSKRYVDGKQDTCKDCNSEYLKVKKEYNCPSCNKTTLLQSNAYRQAIKHGKSCKKCTINGWQKKKYGEKKITEFTSNCPNCGVLKQHKWNNMSSTKLINIQNQMNKKLCKNCSNTIFYTLPLIKTNTKPEIKFKEILEKLDIKFIQNFKFKYNHYDFYLNELNILVEIDGTYWHGKDLEWEQLNSTQKKSRKNDIKKNQVCLENDQLLLRLWEDELEEENIIKKLKLCKKKNITS